MRSYGWVVFALLCVPGLVARAEVIRDTSFGQGADTYLTNDVNSQGPDSNYGTENRMRFCRQNGTSRCKIGYIRFDVSEVAGDLSDAYMIFNMTWNKGGAKTIDVYGLNDGEHDFWIESGAGGVTYNTAPGLATATAGTYALDTANVTLLGTLGTPATPASTDDYPVEFSTNPTDLPLADFINADTNGVVTFFFIGGDNECEVGTKENTTVGIQFPTLVMPSASLGRATAPVPSDESHVNRDLLTELNWTLLPGVSKCDIYFGTEPNAPDPLKMAMVTQDPAGESVSLSAFGYTVPLAEGTYYWRIDCYDDHPTDPNVFVGPYWSFEATSAPVFNSITPAHQAKFAGEMADDITVAFTSTQALSYTWYQSQDDAIDTPADDVMVGGNSDVLSLGAIDEADAGWYYCIAANGGQTPSETVRVSFKKMVAHYGFDGSAADASGNGLDGVEMGTVDYPAGVVGNALLFNGTDTYVDCPNDFSDFTPGLTFTVWANPSAASNWARFIDLGNGAGMDNLFLTREGTTATLRFDSSAGVVTAANQIVLNEWQFFAVTVDEAGAATLYKNGIPVATGTVGAPAIVTRTSNFIGESQYEADSLYAGLLDDVQIYNYALTADDIADMYAGVAGDFCRYPEMVPLDLNGNCVVDLSDVAMLAEVWLDCGLYSCN